MDTPKFDYEDMHDNIISIFGQNVRKERERRGITLSEFAELLDISETSLGLIERGDRGTKIEKIVTIARLFHMPVDALLTDETTDIMDYTEKEKCDILYFLSHLLTEAEIDFIITVMRDLRKQKNHFRKNIDTTKYQHKTPEMKIIFGKNLRNTREKHGLSLKQFAAVLDINEAFLELIEKGERGAGTKVMEIASEYFNVPLDDFFTDTEKDIDLVTEK